MASPHTSATTYKTNPLKNNLCFEDILNGDLTSLVVSILPASQTLKKQPDYLLSPSPVKKDLFAQLLGTQCKQNIRLFSSNLLIEQEQSSNSDEQQYEQSESSNSEQLSYENDPISDNADFIKKRKRKSTAQMKILKQELFFDPNWGKNTITKMAKITGLSQSQVYKWFWDQKKKNKAQIDNTIKKKILMNQESEKGKKTIFYKKSEKFQFGEDKTCEKVNKKLIFN